MDHNRELHLHELDGGDDRVLPTADAAPAPASARRASVPVAPSSSSAASSRPALDMLLAYNCAPAAPAASTVPGPRIRPITLHAVEPAPNLGFGALGVEFDEEIDRLLLDDSLDTGVITTGAHAPDLGSGWPPSTALQHFASSSRSLAAQAASDAPGPVHRRSVSLDGSSYAARMNQWEAEDLFRLAAAPGSSSGMPRDEDLGNLVLDGDLPTGALAPDLVRRRSTAPRRPVGNNWPAATTVAASDAITVQTARYGEVTLPLELPTARFIKQFIRDRFGIPVEVQTLSIFGNEMDDNYIVYPRSRLVLSTIIRVVVYAPSVALPINVDIDVFDTVASLKDLLELTTDSKLPAVTTRLLSNGVEMEDGRQLADFCGVETEDGKRIRVLAMPKDDQQASDQLDATFALPRAAARQPSTSTVQLDMEFAQRAAASGMDRWRIRVNLVMPDRQSTALEVCPADNVDVMRLMFEMVAPLQPPASYAFQHRGQTMKGDAPLLLYGVNNGDTINIIAD